MATSNRRHREIPGWILLPTVLVGGGGGFLLYERAQQIEENRPAMTKEMERIDAVRRSVDVRSRKTAFATEFQSLLADPRNAFTEQEMRSIMSGAVAAREPELVRTLLTHYTPMMKSESIGSLSNAIENGDMATLRLLLDSGIPPQPVPKKPRELVPRPNRVGGGSGGGDSDILFVAILYRSSDAARLLLQAGADPDRRVRTTRWQESQIVGGTTYPVLPPVRLSAIAPPAVSPPPVTSSGSLSQAARLPAAAPARAVSKPDLTLVVCTPRQLALKSGDPALIAIFNSSAKLSRK